MEENLIGRLVTLMNHLEMTPNAFAKESSIDPSHWNKMLKGELTITKKTFDKIYKAFPRININWVKTGKGEMLLVDNFKPYKTSMTEYGGVSDVKVDYKSDGSDYVPLLPVEAMAGTLQGFSEGVELYNCRKIKSPVKGADWAIQISGDSMEPDYKNGSYLFIKKLTGGMMMWGHTMVVDTLDGVVVKQIYPLNDDFIEARSINTKYPPFQIEKSIILGFYRVLGGVFINSTI